MEGDRNLGPVRLLGPGAEVHTLPRTLDITAKFPLDQVPTSAYGSVALLITSSGASETQRGLLLMCMKCHCHRPQFADALSAVMTSDAHVVPYHIGVTICVCCCRCLL